MHPVQVIDLVLPNSAEEFISDPEIEVIKVFCDKLNPDIAASDSLPFQVHKTGTVFPVDQLSPLQVELTNLTVQYCDIILGFGFII